MIFISSSEERLLLSLFLSGGMIFISSSAEHLFLHQHCCWVTVEVLYSVCVVGECGGDAAGGRSAPGLQDALWRPAGDPVHGRSDRRGVCEGSQVTGMSRCRPDAHACARVPAGAVHSRTSAQRHEDLGSETRRLGPHVPERQSEHTGHIHTG